MEEQIWYLYQSGHQLGPFDTTQLKQLYTNSMMNQDAYVFKAGWKDWRPLEECLEEIGIEVQTTTVPPSPDHLSRKRQNAPRATVAGRVDFHNNAKFVTGLGVNISASGIFVESHEHLFEIGELLRLTIRIDGIDKPFNALAKVVRFNANPEHPVGYGLMFSDVSSDLKRKIQSVVDEFNQRPNSTRTASSL